MLLFRSAAFYMNKSHSIRCTLLLVLQQADYIDQEEAPVPACAAVETTGTQAVAGIVLPRVDHECSVVLGG